MNLQHFIIKNNLKRRRGILISSLRKKIIRRIYYNNFNARIEPPSFDKSIILNTKVLVIIACHTDSEIRFKTIINNIKYFKKSHNTDLIIVNSLNLPLSESLKNMIQEKCTYYEIENSSTYDHGKWIYALENTNYHSYNNVIFTNDSYIIHWHIDLFLLNTIKSNAEIYGYTDCSERNIYHYQSYLFSIKSSAVIKFITMYYSAFENIHSFDDLINNCEIKMLHFFDSKDCFLKITKIPGHDGNNIFYAKRIYNILKTRGFLPFTKIKQLIK